MIIYVSITNKSHYRQSRSSSTPNYTTLLMFYCHTTYTHTQGNSLTKSKFTVGDDRSTIGTHSLN